LVTPAAMVDGGPALAPGRVAMSVAVAPEHAAAGLLRAGDRVAVVASGTPDQPDVRAGVVLSSVPVLSVLAPPADGGGEGRLLVSVAVALGEAPLLARAAQGTIDLVLLPRAGDG
jgi:Flp pilus assembly protein CpaB